MGRGRPTEAGTLAATVTATVRFSPATIVCTIIASAAVLCFQCGDGQVHNGPRERCLEQMRKNSACIGFWSGRKDQGQDRAWADRAHMFIGSYGS